LQLQVRLFAAANASATGAPVANMIAKAIIDATIVLFIFLSLCLWNGP
jgi:hypothetical protein